MRSLNRSNLRLIRKLVLWAAGLFLALLCVSYHERALNELISRYRYECPMRLYELRGRATMWASFEGHGFPSNLTFFVNGYRTTAAKERVHLHPLLCPGSKTKLGDVKTIAASSDYEYVNWSKWFTSPQEGPGSYPMLYDRRTSNHMGRGVFVVRVDGSVMWDVGVEWLTEFAKRHPEYQIPLPEQKNAGN